MPPDSAQAPKPTSGRHDCDDRCNRAAGSAYQGAPHDVTHISIAEACEEEGIKFPPLRSLKVYGMAVAGTAVALGFGLLEVFLKGKLAEMDQEQDLKKELDRLWPEVERLVAAAPLGPAPWYAPQVEIMRTSTRRS